MTESDEIRTRKVILGIMKENCFKNKTGNVEFIPEGLGYTIDKLVALLNFQEEEIRRRMRQ